MARRGKEDAIDWSAVERQYRLGQKSNLQLAHEFSISPSSIGRKAKTLGWVQDKAKEVEATTNALLIQNALGNANPNATPSALEVKAAAQSNADLILGHRVGLRRLAALRDGMVSHLESTVSNFADMEEVIRAVRQEDEDGVDRANDKLRQVLSRSSVIDDIKKLAEIDEKVRKGQREAYSIGEKSSEGGYEDMLENLGRKAAAL